MRFSSFVAAVVLAGCSASQVCVPGKTDTCRCPDGSDGAQACLSTGAGYGECQCAVAKTDGGTNPILCGSAAAPNCGAHGVCVNGASGASCACQTGYSGAACVSCATGFQDNDGNGTCAPTCAGLQETCSGHGVCRDSSGTATCDCTGGFTGPGCATCATGTQDNDHDNTCTPSCAATSCQAHATCADATGTAVCSCATGFQDKDSNGSCTPDCATTTCQAHATCADSTGTAVCSCTAGFQDKDSNGTCTADCASTTCAANSTCADSTGTAVCGCNVGFQDKDTNGSCTPDCAHTTCPTRSTCADSTGTATCTCDTGYSGATCTACATGFQDNDSNGTCLPNCATAVLACDARASCADTSGQAKCGCLAGYSGDAGVGCAWSGVIRDPGLQGLPAGQWATEASVTWSTSAVASIDPGSVDFSAPANCALTALFQTGVTLPLKSTPDHLAMHLTAKSGTGSSGLYARFGSANLYAPLPFGTTDWSTVDVCLGESVYGQTSSLEVRAGDVFSFGNSCTPKSITLDHLEVAPSNLCPAVGAVLNGDLEDTTTIGWKGATIVANGTVNNSRALHFAACGVSTAAESVISIPTEATLSSPALRLSMNASAGASVAVGTTTLIGLARFLATGSTQTVSVCLPKSQQGLAVPLLVQAISPLGNACITADVDDLRIVSDPACAGLETNPFNGGFEKNDFSTGMWRAYEALGTHSIDTTPGIAHSGTGAMKLVDASVSCSGSPFQPIFALVVSVPSSKPGAGPKISYWYKTATSSASTRFIIGNQGLVNDDTLSSASWTQKSFCVPPKLAGADGLLRFQTGVCGTLYLDDVQVTTDVSCPP